MSIIIDDMNDKFKLYFDILLASAREVLHRELTDSEIKLMKSSFEFGLQVKNTLSINTLYLN